MTNNYNSIFYILYKFFKEPNSNYLGLHLQNMKTIEFNINILIEFYISYP